ncbi:DUF6614 family protein [Roseovarius sp. B08]|uniref:DUF6614 family protein n=1 Tax=Roseovarius sp. B08 TaxID=3449223 RepID=UPI003EDC9680
MAPDRSGRLGAAEPCVPVGRTPGHEAETLYARMHDMIDSADFALYHAFPNPARTERPAIVNRPLISC